MKCQRKSLTIPSKKQSYIGLVASEERCLHDLFNNLYLGQNKPSQLFRKMKTLFGHNTMSDTVLCKLWMDKLHSQTTQILALLQDDLELEQLAEIVDKIYNNKPMGTVFTAIQTLSIISVNDSHKLICIKESLANLTLQLKTLQHTMQQQKFTPTTSARWSQSPRHRSTSTSKNKNNYDTCWYHFRFGWQARRCDKTCKSGAKLTSESTAQQAGKRPIQQHVKTTFAARKK